MSLCIYKYIYKKKIQYENPRESERENKRGQTERACEEEGERASAAACDRGEFRVMRSLVFLSDFPYFPSLYGPPIRRQLENS